MIRVAGDAADGYVAVLRRLLAVGRAGAQFVDGRRLDAHVGFLGPAGSHGVYDGLDVDPASGLPSLRELLRVRADHDIAAAFLRDHGARLPQKAAYYRAVGAAELVPAMAIDVRLRARDGKVARFEVVHDRIDAAIGCFVRFTVQLEARGTKLVDLKKGDLSEPTERFRRVVERYAGADAEVALLLLAELDGVKVREVVRGQIGPLHFAGVPGPALLAPAIDGVPGAFVLHLTLERASVDVRADVNRDPLATMYRDALGPELRAGVEQRRAALGYHVTRERRLICTPSAEARLKSALKQAGARVLVRSA